MAIDDGESLDRDPRYTREAGVRDLERETPISRVRQSKELLLGKKAGSKKSIVYRGVRLSDDPRACRSSATARSRTRIQIGVVTGSCTGPKSAANCSTIEGVYDAGQRAR